MTDHQMTEQEFSDLVSAYGGEPQRWPQQHRAAMLAYCDTTASAQAMRGREASLDQWLSNRLDAAPEALTARIESQMQEHLAHAARAGDLISQEIDLIASDTFTRRHYVSAGISLAACLIAGVILAPEAISLFIGAPDTIASIGFFTDELLLN